MRERLFLSIVCFKCLYLDLLALRWLYLLLRLRANKHKPGSCWDAAAAVWEARLERREGGSRRSHRINWTSKFSYHTLKHIWSIICLSLSWGKFKKKNSHQKGRGQRGRYQSATWGVMCTCLAMCLQQHLCIGQQADVPCGHGCIKLARLI